MRAIPGTTVKMSLSPDGRPKEGLGSSFGLGGAPIGSCEFSEFNPRAGPSRGTWSSWCLPKTESPHAKCGTKEKNLFVRITSSELFLHPLVRELEDLHLRCYGEYCKSCGGQWHRGGAEWHERAIESPLLSEKVHDSPQVGLQATTQVSVFAPEAANKAMACAISVGNA